MSRANREHDPLTAALGALLCLAASLASACGSGDDSGPPKLGDNDPQIVASVPGTCRKLCCSASDCASTGECRAFDTKTGTIGACTTASPPSTSQASTLPAGCWTGSAAACQPMSGQGCDPGEICDYDEGDDSLEPAILCSSGLEAHDDGESCDAVYGPYCKSGYHCVPNSGS